MSEVQKYVVNSVSEYVKVISEIGAKEKDQIWFRGHTSAMYRLEPSVFRKAILYRDARGYLVEDGSIVNSSGSTVTGLLPERMLDEFKRKAVGFVKSQPRNDFEWLFLMQHYGVPTRLLDWSTNALVALFFALQKNQFDDPKHKEEKTPNIEFLEDEFSERGAAVFVINPATINNALHEVPAPVDVSEDYARWKHYVRPMESESKICYFPICILAANIDMRIRSQSGVFTLHGANIWPLDYYTDLRDKIYKIFISYENYTEMNKELYHLGMTTSFVVPDLGGVATEIARAESARFKARKLTGQF